MSLRRVASLLVLPIAASATAVFPNYGEDTVFTSVGQFGGSSGVAIDTRWVLSAEHVNGSVFTLPGFGAFNVVENVTAPIVGNRRPDLRLLRVDRDLPFFTRIDTRLPLGGTITIVGFGETGTEQNGGYGIPGGTAGTRRAATNRIERLEDITFDSSPAGSPRWETMVYNLTAPNGDGRTANEGGLAGGDSGGGFFHDFGDGQRLVATNSAISGPNENDNNAFQYGGLGYGTYLGSIESQNFIRQFVPQALVPEPASLAALGLGALAMLRRRRR